MKSVERCVLSYPLSLAGVPYTSLVGNDLFVVLFGWNMPFNSPQGQIYNKAKEE